MRSTKPGMTSCGSMPLLVAAFVEPGLGAGGVLRRRQIGEGQEVAGFQMRAGLFEIGPVARLRPALRPHRGTAHGIGGGGMTLRLDENRPSGAEATKGIVETPGDGDQLGLHSAVEVRATKARGALKTAVLVEDDAFAEQRRPRAGSRRAGALRLRYSARFIMAGPVQTERCAGMRRCWRTTSTNRGSRLAAQTAVI